MLLRQVAKELGISPAYLSYMLNGKRPWRKYSYGVTWGLLTLLLTVAGEVLTMQRAQLSPQAGNLERKTRFELATPCLARKAEIRLNRLFTSGKQPVD